MFDAVAVARLISVHTTPVIGAMPAITPPASSVSAGQVAGALQDSEAARRLLQPGALAVTTGQQPGLFGGPMYVIHKALAARSVARRLEQLWDRPVVPVFWMAGDDHDWDEATRTAWWNHSGDVVQWALQPRDPSGPQLPMYREPLPADLAAARDRIAADLPRGSDRDHTLDWIDRHWHQGATIHSAFASGVGELLQRLGVAAIDATHPDLKLAQRPLIARALEAAPEIAAALAAGDQPRQVATDSNQTLVFVEGASGRDRLVIDVEGFRTRRGGELFSPDEVSALLDEQPTRFSANVLLRPVVEAALLPTVAYVAGPGELRYLREQASLVYPFLSVVPQVPVPRWGGMVVDQVSQRLLSRLDLGIDQVRGDDGSLGKTIARSDLPESIPEALGNLRQVVDEVSGKLTEEGTAIDAVLPRAIESRRRRLQLVVEDLESLLLRHHRKRDGVAAAQYRRLRSRLMPLDIPQERLIGVAAALGQWGEQWLDGAGVAADQWADRMFTAADQATGGKR